MEEEVEHEGCMNQERLGDSLFKASKSGLSGRPRGHMPLEGHSTHRNTSRLLNNNLVAAGSNFSAFKQVYLNISSLR
ncbi:hypothetical protein EYF80_034169 [Liparis tanakae]|uniref:Uncharacterized protein n=1 Tax=Liparis tanakae TaxID=230148 RepID=A0A4Z2GSA1_9TELE|nr:hypothetical protein EYF80_034169 [Liparis tanakae]